MNVLKIDFRAKDAPILFTKSLRETGFAVLTHHPIREEMINQIYVEWEKFFASKEKFNYFLDPTNQDGYVSTSLSETAKGYNVKDLKEFYHVYPWGRYPAGLSPLTLQLYEQMSTLAATLLEWVENNTPAEITQKFSMPLREMIKNSPKTLLRVIHYPPLNGDEPEGAVRAAEHEDINMLTLLPAATASGLQVKDNRGNWHEVPCDHGTLVVNVGDSLQMCSENYFPSTTHRVVNPEGVWAQRSRMSMPLFLHGRSEVRLSSTHTQGEYLIERLEEIGLV